MKSQPRIRSFKAKLVDRQYKLSAIERVVPESYNPAAGGLTPRFWMIEITEGLPCELTDAAPFSSIGFSSNEAEQSLLGHLRLAGLSGTVKIKRDDKAA